ncbi:potassium channel family protein [Aerococcus suis]|uniref:Trk system potassium uptake protein TrkA n=1 Tax=Aerococcus suis TaxID=371602 RepID=A0A1W1ZA50_9LACT|nr:TrkA family potassium uptake protein [Aerococcus suis]MCI7239957.1 TrkA family potassium uptake protein [Aerococcus suis]MDD7758543.1 TrkA family potassium uptake protein [Aerococcus suis]MDY4646276.1 TrkA family potassium uptake protein [Aerococcus suis]SMC44838.1 trk system potassium uptake protein TrkA [Aerococcus suis]
MKQFVVIGCGRFGAACATELTREGYDVLLIDNNEETVDDMSKVVTHAIYIDHLSESNLKSAGVGNFDTAIIAIASNFEAAVLSTAVCKKLGVNQVIVKAKDQLHAEILTKIGADRTIIPESESAIRLAKKLTNDNIFDYMDFSVDYAIAEIKPLQKWVNKRLDDLDLRQNHDLNVIAIKSNTYSHINPDPNYIIQPEDYMLVIGPKNHIEKIQA